MSKVIVAEEQETRAPSVLTAGDVRRQVNLIQEVMRDVMQEDTHYGVIPGCGKKPSLLKAGAEKIASTFQLAPMYEVQRLVHEASDSAGNPHVEYSVTCTLQHVHTGRTHGQGVGCCSTMESKYRYMRAGNERGNVADVYNTVLKMAKKRALVDAVLTATAASDIFTQDIEDDPSVFTDDGASSRPAPPRKAKVKHPIHDERYMMDEINAKLVRSARPLPDDEDAIEDAAEEAPQTPKRKRSPKPAPKPEPVFESDPVEMDEEEEETRDERFPGEEAFELTLKLWDALEDLGMKERQFFASITETEYNGQTRFMESQKEILKWWSVKHSIAYDRGHKWYNAEDPGRSLRRGFVFLSKAWDLAKDYADNLDASLVKKVKSAVFKKRR